MSDNEPDKARLGEPGYQEAREACLELNRKLQEIGWSCHMGYDHHFFLEPTPKREPKEP